MKSKMTEPISAQRFREHETRHYLKVLQNAMRLEAWRTGQPVHSASEITLEQARSKEPAVRQRIEALFEAPSVTGKLYAALLLREIDYERGLRGLAELRQSSALVSVPFGDILTPRRVCEIVEDLLAGRAMCFIPAFIEGDSTANS
jgi:hypothetical protein